MDNNPQFSQQGDTDNRNEQRIARSQNALATASFTMGIIAIASICCIYLSLFCGALSIIFAVLSKTRENRYQKQAKTGMLLSVIGIILSIVLIIIQVFIGIRSAGGVDQYVDQYQKMYDKYYDYMEEMYDDSL